MNILRKERGRFPTIDVAYLPQPCMHCDNAPCIKAAQNNAVYKRPDGIVIIDPQKAQDQQQIAKACPYGAIWWNKEKNTPQKCTLCAHLLDDDWKVPRCVQACPTGALTIHQAEPEELEIIKHRQELSVLSQTNAATAPRVFYKNLYRFKNCFIAGSVATRKNEIEECLAKVKVQLIKDKEVLEQTQTDAFGDFKFDGLLEDSGAYQVLIGDEKVGEEKMDVSLGKSTSVGTVWV
jgi:Fe-S-cluster-containing dehydrogenase component